MRKYSRAAFPAGDTELVLVSSAKCTGSRAVWCWSCSTSVLMMLGWNKPSAPLQVISNEAERLTPLEIRVAIQGKHSRLEKRA